MFRFMIFNIPVTVQPWFWLTLAFISGRLFADSTQDIIFLLLFLVAGFISILVHELGHTLTAKHFAQRVEIVLQAFGGYAAYSGTRLSRKQSFMITAAGGDSDRARGFGAGRLARCAGNESEPQLFPYRSRHDQPDLGGAEPAAHSAHGWRAAC